MLAVLWAGFACGVLDITAAFVVYGFFGAKPVPLLQGIASGLLGPKAFDGGLATALLGLLCHFVIAFGAATVYSVASRALRVLVDQAVVFGALYGVAVYFFMNRIVLPLSAVAKRSFSLKLMIVGVVIHIFCVGPKRPFSLKLMIVGVVIHIFCVGLPISLSLRRFSK